MLETILIYLWLSSVINKSTPFKLQSVLPRGTTYFFYFGL